MSFQLPAPSGDPPTGELKRKMKSGFDGDILSTKFIPKHPPLRWELN